MIWAVSYTHLDVYKRQQLIRTDDLLSPEELEKYEERQEAQRQADLEGAQQALESSMSRWIHQNLKIFFIRLFICQNCWEGAWNEKS